MSREEQVRVFWSWVTDLIDSMPPHKEAEDPLVPYETLILIGALLAIGDRLDAILTKLEEHR